MTTKKTNAGEPFFFYFSSILLALVVEGFGVNALINFDKLPDSSPVIFVHGIIMVFWYGLVVLQTKLIGKGNYDLNIFLGKTSIILAVGIIITGILITLKSYHRPIGVEMVTINIFILVNFIILYALALKNRNSPDKHKRFVLFASLAMLLPALGRITQAVGINDFFSLLWLVILILMVVVYDFRPMKKFIRQRFWVAS